MQIQSAAVGRKSDIRGLTLGMGKTEALDLVTGKLGAQCVNFENDGLSYTCNAAGPRTTYGLSFTASSPHVLLSLIYTFPTTHARDMVIADVTRSYSPPLAGAVSVDWATWSLGRSLKLHLRGGSNERYDLILDDDAMSNHDYEAVQRARNKAPPPRF